jgi:peptide/nickel transport system permease protein
MIPGGEVRPGMGRFVLHTLRHSPLTAFGLAIVLLYVIVAVFAPLLAPPVEGSRSPYEMQFDPGNDLARPGGEHPFGTGKFGHDIYYGVVWGARVSMAMGLTVVACGIIIGLVLGLIAGYFGGWVDEGIMRLTEVFLALPLLVLAIAVAVAFSHDPVDYQLHIGAWNIYHIELGRTLDTIVLALVVTWWPSYARLVRGQVLAIREMPYVEAARASGLREWRIMWRHILPNATSPVIVQATLDIGTVVLVAAALAFVGFGPPNLAEWGSLVSTGAGYMATGQWWTFTYPGLAIFGFVLGFNLLGDGLRDILDPRSRQ